MADERNWTPVANGEVYCSPACGMGCTRAAYDEAQRQGRKLAETLGEGWKPRIWENLGWHYSAVSGICAVHPRHPQTGGYTAFFNANPQTLGEGDTPQEAVNVALARARHIVLRLEAALAPFGGTTPVRWMEGDGYRFALVPRDARVIAVPQPVAATPVQHEGNVQFLMTEAAKVGGVLRGKLLKDAVVYAGTFGLSDPTGGNFGAGPG